VAGRIFGQIMDIGQSKDLRVFLNLFPQSSNILKSKIVQETIRIANMYKLDKNVLTRLN
jgi:hypothetical protein